MPWKSLTNSTVKTQVAAMADTDNLSGIGDALRSVMSSPEFGEILSAVAAGAGTGADSAQTARNSSSGGDTAYQSEARSGEADTEEPSQRDRSRDGYATSQPAQPTQSVPVATSSGAQNSAAGSFNIPPELMSKLPQMISALSGMGLDPAKLMSAASSFGGANSHQQRENAETGFADAKGRHNEKQRKALLNSLRPYLNEKRRGIVDNMLKL
ncbi:MAG: hypothetical protein ACI4SJ_04960, partial [Candidatus Avispirillum sp.]